MVFLATFKFILLLRIKKKPHSPAPLVLFPIGECPLAYATPLVLFSSVCLALLLIFLKTGWRCLWMILLFMDPLLIHAWIIWIECLTDVLKLILFLILGNVISWYSFRAYYLQERRTGRSYKNIYYFIVTLPLLLTRGLFFSWPCRFLHALY